MSNSEAHNPLLRRPERPLPSAIGVIGAGTIGPDIAYYLKSALPGLRLVLVDVVQDALDRAQGRIQGYVDKGLRRRKLTEEQAAGVTRDLVCTLDYEDLAECDWVLEAATENLALKHQIFARIEDVIASDALITSNTSSLPAARLFSELAHPERATVTHFFAPAFRNPIVEVIDWEKADASMIEYLRWFFCHTGKVPMVTSDAICFMLDRVFDNWCNEAAFLLEEATAAQIDSVASELVHAGPFYVLNLANGNPIIVETNTLQMEEGDHYRPADILRSVDRWKTVRPGQSIDVPEQVAARVRDRLRGVLFSQSVDIIDRGIGRKDDLNLGCALALGFKQGPFDLMEEVGNEDAQRILARFAEERPGMPMPERELTEYRDFSRWVQVDDLDGVKVITLRRPQARNALDDRMTDEVLAVLERYENDPEVAGFVIVGYGPDAFCAGADIGRFPDLLGDADGAAGFARDCSRLLVKIDAMTKPVVAAANGIALGGGLELALRCHAMVAARHAWFQFPEVSLGIAPGIGGMVVPYRRWPQAAEIFHSMLRTAMKLPAAQAAEIGVVSALADSYEELVALAVRRVKELEPAMPAIAAGPVDIPPCPEMEAKDAAGKTLSREVVGIISDAIAQGARAESLSEALEVGYRAFGSTACTAAAKEGIAAFGERRAPDFEKTG